jgi:hypothetical protein
MGVSCIIVETSSKGVTLSHRLLFLADASLILPLPDVVCGGGMGLGDNAVDDTGLLMLLLG